MSKSTKTTRRRNSQPAVKKPVIEMERQPKKIALTAEEKETVIRYDETKGLCTIYTCSRSLITKLDKFCKSNPENYQLIAKDEYSKTYTTNKKFVSFRAGGKRNSRVLTDEQKKAAGERMRAMHEKRKKNKVES